MEFFNKKEEVLEIVLTQKGKELFASGTFNPFYYSFHDTDIIYQSPIPEEQNDIALRIKETPRTKQNTCVYQNSSNSRNLLKQKQNLYCEIGSKTFGDQYKPAWHLNFIKSPAFQYVGSNPNSPTDTKKYQIKLSSSIDNNNVNQELIPQIDIQTTYKIVQLQNNLVLTSPLGSKNNPFKTLQEYEASKIPGPVYYLDQDGNIEEAINDNQGNPTGKTNKLEKFLPKIEDEFYFVKDNQTILNIAELNSFENYEKQEFEIEGFYIENGLVEELTFNKNLSSNIFKYLNILFDNNADFDIKVNTKNIYGNLVEKDESNC